MVVRAEIILCLLIQTNKTTVTVAESSLTQEPSSNPLLNSRQRDTTDATCFERKILPRASHIQKIMHIDIK